MHVVLLSLIIVSVASAAPLVNTLCGPALGSQSSMPHGQYVNSWRSLPFARAPVDSLRFEPPVPGCWPAQPSPYDATKFKQACVQSFGGLTIGSEDCLFLDVHVPSTLNLSDPRGSPVLFYIHGGAP